MEIVFHMEREKKKDGRTFSSEATYSFLLTAWDYINRVMACAMKQGFDKKEPVDEFDIIIKFKVNGKEFNQDDVLKAYPKLVGLSIDALAKMILEKAYGNGGK